MSWKNITVELSDKWIIALEKLCNEYGFKDIEEVAQHAIIVYLQKQGYID